MQSEGEIGVLRQSVEAEPAGALDRGAAQRADRARHDGDAIPAIVGAPVEVEAAGVFERLATGDETAQVADLGMTRNRDHALVAQWPNEQADGVALQMRIGIEKHDQLVLDQGQAALQGDGFATVRLPERLARVASACAIFSTSTAVPSREPSSTTRTSSAPA